jgi:hypothetical protein
LPFTLALAPHQFFQRALNSDKEHGIVTQAKDRIFESATTKEDVFHDDVRQFGRESSDALVHHVNEIPLRVPRLIACLAKKTCMRWPLFLGCISSNVSSPTYRQGTSSVS